MTKIDKIAPKPKSYYKYGMVWYGMDFIQLKVHKKIQNGCLGAWATRP